MSTCCQHIVILIIIDGTLEKDCSKFTMWVFLVGGFLGRGYDRVLALHI